MGKYHADGKLPGTGIKERNQDRQPASQVLLILTWQGFNMKAPKEANRVLWCQVRGRGVPRLQMLAAMMSTGVAISARAPQWSVRGDDSGQLGSQLTAALMASALQ